MPRKTGQHSPLKRFLTVRNRLFIGTACMLIPLLAAIFVSVSAFNALLEFTDELIFESSNELMPAITLQRDMQKLLTLLHDEARGPASLPRVEELVAHADQQFASFDHEVLGHADEVEALKDARQIWVRLRPRLLSEEIFQRKMRPEELLWFDGGLEEIQDQLDVVVYVTGEELKFIHDQADGRRDRAGLQIGLTLLVALIMASFFGHVLAQSILRPLRELHDGAEHFGRGDLKHRVPAHRHDELGMVATAFNRMALRLERSHRTLRRLSTRDYLTNLFNAREFYRLLDAELGRAKRYEEPLTLLLLDVDHFKQVNDSFGHQSGDKVLRELAKVLRAQVREVDMPARVGGEEFAVILPKTGGEAALGMAERIRRQVEANRVVFNGEGAPPVHVTVSIGLAIYPHSASDAQGLFHAADVALYHAKQSGRNRVSIA